MNSSPLVIYELTLSSVIQKYDQGFFKTGKSLRDVLLMLLLVSYCIGDLNM